ncbi:aldolase [Rhizobium leguminosarum bv. viciae]|nr:aldolase [Rhizobium leguminosarum bv. viciae]
METETELRKKIVHFGALLYQRHLAHGSAGNLSARLEDGNFLVTPTNSSLGALTSDQISKVSADGKHMGGLPPSKEAFFHLAVYEERATAGAIVHLHSSYAAAVSCLCHDDPSDVFPPLTAYQVMRLGKVPLLRYFRPGDRALADEVRATAREHKAMLLANHGPIVSARTIEEAVYAYEEFEETAKISIMLNGRPISRLTANAISDIEKAFPN